MLAADTLVMTRASGPEPLSALIGAQHEILTEHGWAACEFEDGGETSVFEYTFCPIVALTAWRIKEFNNGGDVTLTYKRLRAPREQLWLPVGEETPRSISIGDRIWGYYKIERGYGSEYARGYRDGTVFARIPADDPGTLPHGTSGPYQEGFIRGWIEHGAYSSIFGSDESMAWAEARVIMGGRIPTHRTLRIRGIKRTPTYKLHFTKTLVQWELRTLCPYICNSPVVRVTAPYTDTFVTAYGINVYGDAH